MPALQSLKHASLFALACTHHHTWRGALPRIGTPAINFLTSYTFSLFKNLLVYTTKLYTLLVDTLLVATRCVDTRIRRKSLSCKEINFFTPCSDVVQLRRKISMSVDTTSKEQEPREQQEESQRASPIETCSMSQIFGVPRTVNLDSFIEWDWSK